MGATKHLPIDGSDGMITSDDAEAGGGDEPASARSLPRAVARTLQGGLFATAVMTAFRLPILQSLPPTANFWAKYVGNGHPEDYHGIGLLLHFEYGSVAGAVFGLLYATLNAFPGRSTETRGVVWGGIYGLALSVFGEHVLIRWLLDMDLDEDTTTIFHASHMIYGIALGGWVGSRMNLSRSYEEYEHAG